MKKITQSCWKIIVSLILAYEWSLEQDLLLLKLIVLFLLFFVEYRLKNYIRIFILLSLKWKQFMLME